MGAEEQLAECAVRAAGVSGDSLCGLCGLGSLWPVKLDDLHA